MVSGSLALLYSTFSLVFMGAGRAGHPLYCINEDQAYSHSCKHNIAIIQEIMSYTQKYQSRVDGIEH